ncbi:MAG: hypothetical protein Roseis2KO_39540 [Roseivirga sp.]
MLFLENNAYVEKSINFSSTGYYRFLFKAAWRENSFLKTKYIRIIVDGVEAGEIQIESEIYDEYVTLPVKLNSGWKTVRIEGDNPNTSGSFMGFVDDFRIEQLPVLVNYTYMTVPAGATYVIGSANYNFGILKVLGTLVAPQNQDVNITSNYILVEGNGRFQIGQERSPYTKNATITLNGVSNQVMDMGTKFLGARGSGVIELHGKEKMSWTKLRATVGPTSAQPNKIKLAEPVDWKAGDEIVIAPSRAPNGLNDTGFADEYEKKKILYVTPGSQDLILTSDVAYRHTGQTGVYYGNGQSWSVDMRAEVGLLTRNIKVQGDAASETSKTGAHMMIMGSSAKAYISGVELYRVGQNQESGRYPFHWHHGLDADGEYFKNSSVHRSYNRALTIHRTNNTLVEDNVFFDHIGHGIFFEEGNEEGHKILGNLVIGSKKPSPLEAMSTRVDDGETLDEWQNRGPAAYWITHPNNTIEGNVAAGTIGTGFWYIFPRWDTGNQNKESQKAPFGSFKNNVAHSTSNGFDIFDELGVWDWSSGSGVFYPHSVHANIGYLSPAPFEVLNCTWYANRVGIYTGTGQNRYHPDEYGREIYAPDNHLVFNNNVFADNEKAIMQASNNVVKNSVFIEDTGAGNAPPTGQTLVFMYDGGGEIRDSHIVGFGSNDNHIMSLAGAAFTFGNFRFVDVTKANPIKFNISGSEYDQEGRRNVTIYDQDGSLSGRVNSTLVMPIDFNLMGDQEEITPLGWTNFVRSTRRYVNTRLRVHLYYQQYYGWVPDVKVIRDAPGTVNDEEIDYVQETPTLPFIMNEPDLVYIYDWQYSGNDDITDIMYTGPDVTINGELVNRRVLQFKLANTVGSGDYVIVRFNDMGALPGVYVDMNSDTRVHSLGSSSTSVAVAEKTDLASLKSSSIPAYYKHGDDIYIKALANGDFAQYFNFRWDEIPVRGGVANNTETLGGEKSLTDDKQAVYPNPASDKLYIKGLKAGSEVQVVDLSGRLMQTSTYNNYLDVSQIKSGMYVVRTQKGNFKFKKQ